MQVALNKGLTPKKAEYAEEIATAVMQLEGTTEMQLSYIAEALQYCFDGWRKITLDAELLLHEAYLRTAMLSKDELMAWDKRDNEHRDRLRAAGYTGPLSFNGAYNLKRMAEVYAKMNSLPYTD